MAWRTTYRPTRPSSRLSSPLRCRSLRWLVLLLVGGIAALPLGWAQPPGTLPPMPGGTATETPLGEEAEGTEAARAPAEDRELTPKAFLVLDEAGNPVIVPGLTFEKLDQLLQLQEGRQQPSQLYTLESLEVQGRVAETSAELTVTLRLEVEPTAGRWITVPLRMDNFHRTGPADISGVERYRMDLDEANGGHLLHLRSDSQRQVVVVMRAVCRVAPPPGAMIEFRLPEAPSRVVLEVPGTEVSASVVGRGDEVLRTQPRQDHTEVTLEGGGGGFSLRFGAQLPVVDSRPVLESDTTITLDWQQADNAPIAYYDVAVRSQRGDDLPAFTLSLPGATPLLQAPTVGEGAPFEIKDPLEELRAGGAAAAAAGQPLIEVVPRGDSGDSRVDVSLVTQLRSDGGRPGGTVLIRGVVVSDAIEQTGEINVKIPQDYRLRWNSQPWVSSLWDQGDSDSLTTRTYRFRYDRVPFELPLWLSARAKQLRVEGDYRLTFYDTLASLRIMLRTRGGVPDSKILPLHVGQWRVQSVFVAGTTTPIEADQQEDLLEIDLASLPGGGESERIEIILVHPLAEDQDRVELTLPSVASDQEALGALSSVLTVSAQSDYRFIADLGSSRGIGEVLRNGAGGSVRAASGGAVPGDSLHESRYSLPDISAPGQLVGFLVADRPQVSYQADAEISIDGNRIVEVLNWTVYPQSGLRGWLPISWQGSGDTAAAEGPAAEPATPAAAVRRLPEQPLWSVSVDDTPAILREDGQGNYSIYSDRLGGGPHHVLRLRRTRELPPAVSRGVEPAEVVRLSGVSLPRPGLADSTLRGPMVIRLRGDQVMELAAQDGQGRWSNQLTLAAAPLSELPLRLRHVSRRQDDVQVRKAVLRTAVARNTQHEHLIATVQGGGQFRLPLAGVPRDALVRGRVDSVAVEVFRDSEDHCFVRLGEKGTHQVSIQVWVDRESPLLVDRIAPLLRLPLGAERFYWEIVTPQDDHLVWASPTAGRAMQWHFDRWRLYRQPIQNSTELANWVGTPWDSRLPPGNRYLFVGVDAAALSAVMMSRLAIWLIVGVTVLVVSCLLTYYPVLRHPLVAILGAVLLGGLTLLLPDAAVLVGQVMLVAMLMVAVMAGVSHLLAPRRATRVLGPSSDRLESSTVRGHTASRTGNSGVMAEVATSGSAAEVRG